MQVLCVFVVFVPVPLFGSQCISSSDCSSPHAPHCSKWGWCQWTGLYGEEGPGQGEGLAPGTCVTSQDCTPRAPTCSKLGYCTTKQNSYNHVNIERSYRDPVIQISNVNPVIGRSNIDPVIGRSNINPVIGRSNVNPVIGRSNKNPVIGVTVPAGTIHLSSAEAKTQAQDLRPTGYSQSQDQRTQDFIQDQTYFTHKGSEGDQRFKGPSHGEFQGFQLNLPRDYERRASLEYKSGNREINVFLKSEEGHRGVNQGIQQGQNRDQLTEETITFEQNIEPSIGGSSFNKNNKDERIRTEDNYSNHLPLSNTDLTNRFDPETTPRSTSHNLPSHFNPVPAVPTFRFQHKSANDDFDYLDYPDYERINRNDQYDVNDEEYFYYDDYYYDYDYSLGTEDILKKDDYSLDMERFSSQNEFESENEYPEYPSDSDNHARAKITRNSISKDEPDFNQKSTNRFPFIIEHNTEKQEPARKPPSKPREIPEKVVENPAPGVSQGCLYDCVYECVAIELLTAYRDCVKFCGDACM